MSEMSPKDLDKLFQQGSEHYDFEYNSEAWEQMEILLDKDKSRRFFWWWFAGIGILMLVGVICVMKNNQNTPILAESNIEKINDSITEKKELLKNTSSEKNFDIQSNSKLKTQSLNPEPKNLSSNLFESQKKQVASSEKKEESNEIKSLLPITDNGFTKKAEPDKTLLSDSIFEKIVILESDSLLKSPLNEIIKENNQTKDISRLYSLPIVFLDGHFPKKIEAPVLNFDLNEEDNISPKGNILLLSLVLGGELSSVGTGNFSEKNWKIGAQATYQYKQKYSTSIGANFIRKKYDAGAGEYIPPKGFWTRTIAPQSSSGTCTILEVPVLVGYFPKSYTNKGFYAQAGFTSYFMLRERYNYFYDLPDSDLIREWGTENENRHWFGIGQISLGYQYFLKPKTVVQIAPYVQIPLTGIGHGNVKLWSIGMTTKVNFQIGS